VLKRKITIPPTTKIGIMLSARVLLVTNMSTMLPIIESGALAPMRSDI